MKLAALRRDRRWRLAGFGLAPLILLWFSLSALTSYGVHPGERNNAANSLYERGYFEAAIQAYQAAQVAAPDQPEPYYNAAPALLGAGEFEAAVEAMRQALKTADSQLAQQVYYNLGNVYYEQAMYAEAISAYQEALLLRPDDDDARHNLELALSRLPTPTPLPAESEPQQSEPQPTPTANPDQAPSPAPEESIPTARVQPEGPLTVEEAQRLLDSVPPPQTLREYQDEAVTPVSTPQHDW